MNQVQTRVPGRREPRTEIAGHKATTALAYHRWSAIDVEAALVTWFSAHDKPQRAAAPSVQKPAGTSVVPARKRTRPISGQNAAISTVETKMTDKTGITKRVTLIKNWPFSCGRASKTLHAESYNTVSPAYEKPHVYLSGRSYQCRNLKPVMQPCVNRQVEATEQGARKGPRLSLTFRPRLCRRSQMKYVWISAALVCFASINSANAGLFHKSSCCAPAPSCCAPAPTCAAPAACAPSCCAPAAAAPTCCAPAAAPTCCAPAPTCCNTGCNSCCKKSHCFKLPKLCLPKIKCCKVRKSCCGSTCAPTCGAPAACAPACAAPAACAPTCAAPSCAAPACCR